MITISDSVTTYDLGDVYAILPDDQVLTKYKESQINISPVSDNFVYNSGTNPNFLTVAELRNLIRNMLIKFSSTLELMSIVLKICPYGRQTVTEDDIQAVENVLRSSHLTGPTVPLFESVLTSKVNSLLLLQPIVLQVLYVPV